MKKSTGSKVIKLFLLSGAVMALCPPAPLHAQVPPTPIPEAPKLKAKKPWFQWLAGVTIIGIVSVAAFKGSKRNM